MGCFIKLFLGFIILTLGSVFVVYKKLTNIPPVPTLNETWWGSSKPSKDETVVKPFQIQISNNEINDLNQRLNNFIPLQPSLEGVNQHYGIHSDHLNTIINHWSTKYNWTQRQNYLNKFPQYTITVQGLRIHYIHVKPQKTTLRVFPLLLLHGWPGSVREFYEMIPILTTPQRGRTFVFEVIIPSLPGYGFSEATSKPGLGAAQMATIFKNLMKKLRFDKYYIQGGDWGAIIVKNMAILYPEHILGVHSNMCFVNTPLSNLLLAVGTVLPSFIVTPEEQDLVYPLADKFSYLISETGYLHIQATKPDTAGTALRDSPVGLAAYILEKFTTLTHPAYKDLPDGGLTNKFNLDDLLDNVMIYWVARSMTTSMRLYAETFNKATLDLGLEMVPVIVPSGCARFTNELMFPPQMILETNYHNLLHVSQHEGGHFAAFEVPDVLANDVYEFVLKVETVRSENGWSKNEL